MRTLRRALLAGVATAIVAGTVLAAPVTARAAAGSAPVAVTIHQYRFHPDPLTVEVGQPVTWTNEDAAAHDVTASSGPEAFGSSSLATGQSYTHVFRQPGSYTYICSIHPDMVGSVTVVAAPATTPAPAAVAPSPTSPSPSGRVAASGPATPTTAVAAALAPASSVAAASVSSSPTPAAPDLARAVRPFAELLAVATAVVAACLLLLGVGRDAEARDP
jgi:plastocyanin